MEDIIEIEGTKLSIKEYKGQRVVTFKDIDMVHGRPNGTARKRFSDNRERFIEGEDFFKTKCEEVRPFFGQTLPNGFNPKAEIVLITEQGYLMLVKSFTDDLAWKAQRQLVNGYFRARELANDLSPQMKMLYGMLDQMAETERQAREAKQIAEKAVETTENIKEAVKPVLDDWRETINSKFNRIQRSSSVSFQTLRLEMYQELQRRAGCDLKKRLNGRRERLIENKGWTKSAAEKINYMDVIEDDKKLREIFSKIVTEYEIKYCA